MLIPARYGSSRFPGKPLARIAEKSMIEWVYRHTEETQSAADNSLSVDVAVVTDDETIESHVIEFGGKAVRVDDPVESGTERIFLAWERFFAKENYDFIINVQGDEPLLRGEDLAGLIKYHVKSSFDVATLVQPKTDFSEFKDPNRVKAIRAPESGQCLYFSRAAVPHDRDGDGLKKWHLHIGVYSYRPEALKRFCSLPMSHFEKVEKLEQLRALEDGMTYGSMEIMRDLFGVDTKEDIVKVEGALK